jgi:hypothetical protein
MINKKLLLLCVGISILSQIIYSQVPSFVPTNGLVAHYPFNGNANDESGNAHNGTVMNGAVPTTDRFGNLNNAYSFDGVDDYIIANIGNLQAITVSVWINSSEPIQYYPIVAMYAQYIDFLRMSGNNPIYISNGIVGDINTEYLPATPNYIGTNFNLSFDSWHHIVVVFDNSIGKYELYVDNNLIGSAVTTGPIAPTNSTILFGNSSDGLNADGGGGFKGSIDDVDIWNRALTQQEITNMFNGVTYSDTCNAVSGSLVNGLVAYYPFCGNANDQSGNGLNGVVNGAILTSDRFGNSNSAYVFDGNSKIRCAFSNQFSPDASDNYSFSFWAENTSNNFGMILQYYTYNPTENISNYDFFNSLPSCPSGSYAFQNFPFNSPGGCSPTLVNLNEWNHIVVVIKQVEQTFNVFKNGVFWFNGNVGNIKPYAGFLTIGNVISDTFGYNGKIDDIGIWNRALIPQEITQLYNQNQCVTNITVTDTLIINVGQLSYTNPVTYANNITIYPNPANTQVNISFNNITDLTGGNINIVNSLGQQVATTPITLSGTNTTMQLNSWGGTGLYFVQILNAQGIVVDVKKIILQ